LPAWASLITRKWVRDNLQGNPQAIIPLLPRPDYEYRIYYDDDKTGSDAHRDFNGHKRLR
jgi:hypothetical protein